MIGIHHGGGLIVENTLRLRGQRARDRHGALIAGGEVGGVGVPGMGNVHHFQQSVDHVFFVLLVVILAQLERKQNILRHRERIE